MYLNLFLSLHLAYFFSELALTFGHHWKYIEAGEAETSRVGASRRGTSWPPGRHAAGCRCRRPPRRWCRLPWASCRLHTQHYLIFSIPKTMSLWSFCFHSCGPKNSTIDQTTKLSEQAAHIIWSRSAEHLNIQPNGILPIIYNLSAFWWQNPDQILSLENNNWIHCPSFPPMPRLLKIKIVTVFGRKNRTAEFSIRGMVFFEEV